MTSYTIQRTEGGWQIVRHTKAHKLLPVHNLIEGSFQFGRDDQPGAFCTRHIPESERYVETSAPLLGVFKRKRDAEAWMKGLV
jgi:hypothetical protein